MNWEPLTDAELEAEAMEHEFNSRYDDHRERFGQPCHCGTLTWGGDCPKCLREELDAMAEAEAASEAVLASMPDHPGAEEFGWAPDPNADLDDDIPF